MTRILPGQDPAALREAAAELQAGRLVAFPTETVYGLGADGLNPEAVAEIYRAKGRPANNPLILHVGDVAAARALVAEWPPEADLLAARFWPGPLTLVLPADPGVPLIVRAGNPTVALRCPSHPVALALIRATGRPLAAPSANRSTEISPTTAQHVLKGLEGRLGLILDGGPTVAGLESTILDLSRRPFRLLRPGPLPVDLLETLLGPLERWQGGVAEHEGQAAPGMAARHYAPRTPLRILEPAALLGALRDSANPVLVLFGGEVSAPGVPQRRLPLDPGRVGTALYALLHELDAAGHSEILVQAPPTGDAWWAVADRLQRASAER